MIDLLTYVPGKRRKTPKGWVVFNAVCCHHNGHNKDRRKRGAIYTDGYTQVYKCFNCNFRCGYTMGKPFTQNLKRFLEWCGVADEDIRRLALENLKYKDIMDYIQPDDTPKKVEFNKGELPKDAELLDPTNSKHTRFIEYLNTRGLQHDDYPFMVTPDNKEPRGNNRIIVPFTFKNQIVGHTARFLDDKKPKYFNDQPSGYVFGYDLQKPNWSSCIVTEGIFDALSIDACALGTNTISIEQFHTLRSLNRSVIIVPDHDKAGLELIESALSYGFKVSIPNWGRKADGKPIKDVNDAVVKYGKLPVILSILQNATHSRVILKVMASKRIKTQK